MIATQQDTSDETLAVISAANVSGNQLTEIFTQAINYQQAGRLLDAEKLYLRILEAEPLEPNVNYNLGALYLESNQAAISLPYFKTALETDQNEPQYWVGYIDALAKADQQDLAREFLMKGLELGLHGDAVNALVDQLTRPVTVAQPAPIASPHQVSNPQIQRALALQQSGKLNEAKAQYKKLLKLYPKHTQLLTGLGTIALQQGDTAEGIQLLEKCLSYDTNHVLALGNLAIGYTALNRFGEAVELCNRAIALNPNYAGAHVNRGNALKALRRFDEAVLSYEKAITLNSDNANNYFNLGSVLKELKRYREAAVSFQQVIALNPNDIEAHEHCAVILQELKEYNDSFSHYTHAIRLNKNNAENYYGRGLVNLELGKLEEARTDFEHAVRLNPNNADAHLNLGVAYHKLGRLDEALRENSLAIELNPTFIGAYNNRGLLFVDMRRFDEASADYDQAIVINPEANEAYWNKSILSLLKADFKQGWLLYESRWKTTLKDSKRIFIQPLWLGEQSIKGKTLLIYPEQGLGDFIQFCRYVPMIEALGAKVILETPRALTTLISTLNGRFTMVEQGKSLPDFDYHCPIMSLPLAFKTTVTDIPARIPYLHADEIKQKEWQKKLGAKTKLNVGLVWSGSTVHKNDHHRSIPFEMLKPLFSLPIEFHVLQKEIREGDIDTLSEFDQIKTYPTDLNDFSDTAALIQNMDLVISVDTSVAHLVGAMGKTCWILLPYSPDFRWMIDGNESPWYPSVSLFRQPAYKDWQNVISQVKRGLEADYIS